MSGFKKTFPPLRPNVGDCPETRHREQRREGEQRRKETCSIICNIEVCDGNSTDLDTKLIGDHLYNLI